MTTRLFGTDGVRGVANADLSPELAFRLGEAAVRFAGQKICIGRDTRKSGIMLESALVAGITSAGGDAYCCGIIPTPAIALLVRELGCDGGVVISASHNPAEYNGIKFFSSEGMKLPDEVEDEIEAFIHAEKDDTARPTGAKIGTIVKVKDARERYINHAISTVSGSFEGLRIAVDCGHGASVICTPEALRRLGAEVVAINTDHDGLNINDGCGSTHLEALRELMEKEQVNIGLAHDGDADRVLFIDETGAEIDGDFVLAICGRDLAGRGLLANRQVVSTVMCNLGLTIAMRDQEIELSQTKVGDRYVLERMLADGAVLGGEQSGHVIFMEHNCTGDGLVTALQLIDVMRRSGKKASELRAEAMERFPQALINVHCPRKAELQANEAISEAIRLAEAEMGDTGRVLVRASGTEPLVRVMVEAKSDDDCERHCSVIAQIVERELG